MVSDGGSRKRESDDIKSVHQVFSETASNSGNVVVAELKTFNNGINVKGKLGANLTIISE